MKFSFFKTYGLLFGVLSGLLMGGIKSAIKSNDAGTAVTMTIIASIMLAVSFVMVSIEE